jgi:hypothetical protein
VIASIARSSFCSHLSDKEVGGKASEVRWKRRGEGKQYGTGCEVLEMMTNVLAQRLGPVEQVVDRLE